MHPDVMRNDSRTTTKVQRVDLDMSYDPTEFTEAVEAFARRRVITREEANRLEEYARNRAFWITGIAQMDVAHDAHQSILEAMRSGISFEEWQKTAGAAIEKEWGRKDSPRLLLIFRNAMMSAYNGGRWAQVHEPHVMQSRGFIRYTIVRDERTTEHICLPLYKLVLPLDHPFVVVHVPPLHHHCRTSFVTIREDVALERGITPDDRIPVVEVTPGFGYPPDLSAPPGLTHRKVEPAPELQLELARKASVDARERKPVKVKQKPKHTPEYWEEHYREKYGDELAKRVGYGRAVHERSKDMTADDALQVISGLGNRTWPIFDGSHTYNLGIASRRDSGALAKDLADLAIDKHAVAEAKLLAEHVRLVRGNRVPEMRYGRNAQEADDLEMAKRATEGFWSSMSSSRLPLPKDTKWQIIPDSQEQRAEWIPATNTVRLPRFYDSGKSVHEYAHAVESLGGLSDISRRFVASRTKGEPLKRLRDVLKDPRYKLNEVCRPDKFYEPYIGKDYGDLRCSELVSTVLGHIADGRIAEILRKDPETLYFVLAILAGI